MCQHADSEQKDRLGTPYLTCLYKLLKIASGSSIVPNVEYYFTVLHNMLIFGGLKFCTHHEFALSKGPTKIKKDKFTYNFFLKTDAIGRTKKIPYPHLYLPFCDPWTTSV